MRQKLLSLGHPRVETIDVKSWEWLPAVLLGRSFKFYLDKLDALAQDLISSEETEIATTTTSGNEPRLSVVGHSAGGWLARIWMGEETYDGQTYDGQKYVDTLLTLGTPHLSVEEYPFGRVSEKRRSEGPMSEEARGSSLRFSNEFCDASTFPNCKIICIAGDGIRGGRDAPWAINASYKCTCRKEDVSGDGVCPIESAILPGCHKSLILDDVIHSPVANRRSKWYGDREIVEQWDGLLC